MMAASLRDSDSMIDLLLRKEADVNIKSTSKSGIRNMRASELTRRLSIQRPGSHSDITLPYVHFVDP